jgi:hypothetical protein
VPSPSQSMEAGIVRERTPRTERAVSMCVKVSIGGTKKNGEREVVRLKENDRGEVRCRNVRRRESER